MLRVVRAIVLMAAATLSGCYLSHEVHDPVDAAPADAPRVCPAMDVRTLPSCTTGVDPYWYWDAGECVGSVCACAGSDCGSVLGSQSACQRAFADCRLAP
jgi:hypothetical protein